MGGAVRTVQQRPHRVEPEAEEGLGQALVIHVKAVVLGTAGDVVAVSSQPDKVFLVAVACKRTSGHGFKIEVK